MKKEFGALPNIAVLIPCYNEESSIVSVVSGIKESLPGAVVYVYDNNSTDKTAEKARESGAIVRHERMQGKGNVVRRMFADVDADIYVLIDGDGTYDTSQALVLVKELLEGPYDMVTAIRDLDNCGEYKKTHRLGNRLFSFIVRVLFKGKNPDMFSGYRVLSRRFVKSFPTLSSGFEIETELVIHALELRIAEAEVLSAYRDRKPGSESKLRSFRDGWRILVTVAQIFIKERPVQLFTTIFGILAIFSISLGIPILVTFFRTGEVNRPSTALLASVCMLLAFISFTIGIVLNSTTTARREIKRLLYLSIPAPRSNDPVIQAGQPETPLKDKYKE